MRWWWKQENGVPCSTAMSTQSHIHCKGVSSYPANMAGLASNPRAAITPKDKTKKYCFPVDPGTKYFYLIFTFSEHTVDSGVLVSGLHIPEVLDVSIGNDRDRYTVFDRLYCIIVHRLVALLCCTAVDCYPRYSGWFGLLTQIHRLPQVFVNPVGAELLCNTMDWWEAPMLGSETGGRKVETLRFSLGMIDRIRNEYIRGTVPVFGDECREAGWDGLEMFIGGPMIKFLKAYWGWSY